MFSGRATRTLLAAVATAAVVATTMAVASSTDGGPSATIAPRRLGPDTDPQVLAISLDGLNPDALRRLGRRGAPHLWRLFDEGAGTLNARSEYEQTVTLPNHTGMVTGRRIDRGHGGHGVTWNDDRLRPRTVQRAAHHGVSSVFARVDRGGGSAAVFSTKQKFSLFQRSWPTGVDRSVISFDDDAGVTAAARADLVARDRAFTLLHLGAADKAGHAAGWMSSSYLAAVRRLDGLVGDVLADAERDPALADLTIIVTADHGGVPGSRDHGQRRRPANYTVPFVVWGPGIERADLYAINPGYRDPGRSRPGLTGQQPVRNGDVANLALGLLGLRPVPGSLFGVRRPLRVVAG
ncbi:alkaline phosphatase family protein [Nocardioides sp. C4-1]|uniref:alkaline phosphatase family protein n=1 Tax=Nocardioides sp. C4-1 TaxID=3151851 RepID=UPI003267D065